MTSEVQAQVSRKEAEAPLILALDIGSSSVRAQLFDALGRAVADTAARETHVLHTDSSGASEADPDHLLDLVFRCIDGVLHRAGPLAKQVAGVAADTFVNNTLGVDAAGQAVTALTTYADTRASVEVDRLRAEFDEKETHDRSGCRFHPSYLPARLRWLNRTAPDLFARADRWLSIDEYLHLKLFGRAAVSYSVAAWTGLLDWRRLRWDEALVAGSGITVERLSPLVDFDAADHGLQQPYAARWPILKKVPWFPAAGDGATANIGSGCTTPARVALTVGTSSAMRAVVSGDVPRLPAGLWCYRVDGRRALPGGALTEGGMVHRWMGETLRSVDPEAVAAMPPDAHGLTVLPLFAGERSPGWAGHARATIHGLTLATSSTDILRAGLESVAYRIAQVYELIRPLLPAEPEIIASGGALLSSPTWLQIMADVLGRPIAVSRAQEASARGAALLALQALGVYDDVSDAPDFVGAVFEPNDANHAVYAAAVERQKELYERLVLSSDASVV